MSRKEEKIQVSYYPKSSVRELLQNFSAFGFESRNDMIDIAVQELVKNLQVGTKEKPMQMLERMAKDAARVEIARLYQHVKAAFQDHRFPEDQSLGTALLRAYSKMSDPPVDVDKEVELWQQMLE